MELERRPTQEAPATPAVTAPAPSTNPTVHPTGPTLAPAAGAALGGLPKLDGPKPTTEKVDPAATTKSVSALASELNARFHTSDAKVLAELRGKSPAQIEAIRTQWKARFPDKDFDALIEKGVSGTELKEARAWLHGDKVAGFAHALQGAAGVTSANRARMTAILEQINGIKDDRERTETLRMVKEQFATLHGGKLTVEEVLKIREPGAFSVLDAVGITKDREGDRSLALAAGNKKRAAAIQLDSKLGGGSFGFGKDKQGAYKLLEKLPKKEREHLLKDAEGYAGRKADDRVVDALKEDNTAKVEARKATAAVDGVFTDKQALFAALETTKLSADGEAKLKQKREALANASPQERDRALAEERERLRKSEHDAKIAALKGDLKGDLGKLTGKLSGLDREKAEMLIKGGKLTDSFALKYALNSGVFADAKGVKEVLTGKTTEEIAKLREQYGAQAFDRDLMRVAGSSRDALDIDQLLRGKTNDPAEQAARAQEIYDHERGSAGTVKRFLVDQLSNTGVQLDQQHGRLQKQLATLQAAQQEGGPKAEAARRQFDQLLGFHNEDAGLHHDAKKQIANTAATGAGLAAGGLVTLATGGAAAPALAAAYGGLVSTAATVTTKALIQGGDYGDKELVTDLGSGAVDAATAGLARASRVGAALNRVVGVEGGAKATGSILQEAGKGAITGLVTTGANEATKAAIDGKDAQEVLKAGGLGGLRGLLSGGATGAINKQFPATGSDGRTQVARGALGGALGGLATEAVDKGVADWDKPSTDGIGDRALGFLGAGLKGGFTGAVSSHAARREEDRGRALLRPLEVLAPDAREVAAPAAGPSVGERVKRFAETGVDSRVIDRLKPHDDASIQAFHGEVRNDHGAVRDAAKRLSELGPNAKDHPEAQRLRAELEPHLAALKERKAGLREDTRIERETLRKDYQTARAKGGLDATEGAALLERAHAARLDRLNADEALHFSGFDRGDTRRLLNELNNTAAQTGDANGVAGTLNSDGSRRRDASQVSHDDIKGWADRQVALFDLPHEGKPAADGRPAVPATIERKILAEDAAAGLAAGVRFDARQGQIASSLSTGGFVGNEATTHNANGHQSSTTIGGDYNNSPFLANRARPDEPLRWSDRPVYAVDRAVTEKIRNSLQVPLGPEANRLLLAEAKQRQASGEYGGRLLRVATDVNSRDEHLPAVTTRTRSNHEDPFTGWGFSATERLANHRARDVTPNQELVRGYDALDPGARLARLPSPESDVVSAQEVLRIEQGQSGPSIRKDARGYDDAFAAAAAKARDEELAAAARAQNVPPSGGVATQ